MKKPAKTEDPAIALARAQRQLTELGNAPFLAAISTLDQARRLRQARPWLAGPRHPRRVLS